MLIPTLATDTLETSIKINDDSNVNVTRTSTDTTVCYRYNNDLASMSIDRINGYPTTIIRDINADQLERYYVSLMSSNGNINAIQSPRTMYGISKKSTNSSMIVGIILAIIIVVVVFYILFQSNGSLKFQ